MCRFQVIKRNTALIFLSVIFLLAACAKHTVELPEPPVVNAGPSVEITLPANSLTVTGAVQNSQPVKSYAWTQISGPATCTIVNPESISTEIKELVEGTYVFRLLVTDSNGLQGDDTMTVKVIAATIPGKTISIQSNNEAYDRMIVSVGGTDQSFSGGNEWVIDAWTLGGKPYVGRKAFRIDFGSLPAAATIVNAKLYLYSNAPPENGNLINANYGANNSLVLQRIVAPWDPATTVWNNQPATTTTDQLLIPHTTQSILDLSLDVTALIQAMAVDGNYGFLLKLQEETAYNSRQFVGSHHAGKTDKHPKLVIVYR